MQSYNEIINIYSPLLKGGIWGCVMPPGGDFWQSGDIQKCSSYLLMSCTFCQRAEEAQRERERKRGRRALCSGGMVAGVISPDSSTVLAMSINCLYCITGSLVELGHGRWNSQESHDISHKQQQQKCSSGPRPLDTVCGPDSTSSI